MPAINCRIDRKQHKKLFNIIGEWAESDLAQNNFRDSYDAALKLLVESVKAFICDCATLIS